MVFLQSTAILIWDEKKNWIAIGIATEFEFISTSIKHSCNDSRCEEIGKRVEEVFLRAIRASCYSPLLGVGMSSEQKGGERRSCRRNRDSESEQMKWKGKSVHFISPLVLNVRVIYIVAEVHSIMNSYKINSFGVKTIKLGMGHIFDIQQLPEANWRTER